MSFCYSNTNVHCAGQLSFWLLFYFFLGHLLGNIFYNWIDKMYLKWHCFWRYFQVTLIVLAECSNLYCCCHLKLFLFCICRWNSFASRRPRTTSHGRCLMRWLAMLKGSPNPWAFRTVLSTLSQVGCCVLFLRVKYCFTGTRGKLRGGKDLFFFHDRIFICQGETLILYWYEA